MKIKIIAQQDDFIIADKPAGLGFHDDENQPGFFNQVKSQLSINELYPVHRLDKMTSGLIILAKNKLTATEFQQHFEQRLIEKYYIAISDKKPVKKQGTIKGDMKKSRRGTWKLVRRYDNPAISQFFSYPLKQGKRLFLVKPYTGKTHQIRVALNSIGAPIIGDPNYYMTSNADRGYLHAFALRFSINNIKYQYVLPPLIGKEYTSAETIAVVDTLIEPWKLAWPKLNNRAHSTTSN
ncbi:TIGR01621 family pseudouridine synthase [Colwelliaceae bacterium 6441]